MSSPPFLARPGQPLDDHLDGVVANAERLVAESAQTAASTAVATIARTTAHLHDVGKYTSYFQTYLREDSPRAPNPLERHADVGAFLAYHALAARGLSATESTAGFYAVMRHHGPLPNIRAYQNDLETDTKRFERLGQKLQSIDDAAADMIDRRLRTASGGALGWDAIPIEDPHFYQQQLSVPRELDGFYPLLLRVWSTLTCADKLDAAGITVDETTARPDPSAISFETSAAGVTARLNEKRSQAREECRRRLLAAASDDDGVFTLTLPTGFGKTFAGLDGALSLAEQKAGRVVYALPYTTVIDQVHDAVTAQFDVEPASSKYTIHHHLADTRTQVGDDDEQVTTRAETLYGESWQAGLVLTTFVQLFESLAGPGNLQSIKLPALEDSVIVVDEPQALPRRWWHLVSHLTTRLVEDYDATVVLMTATQPRFVEEYNFDITPSELVEDTSEYVEFLRRNERVRFTVDPSVQASVTDASGGEHLDVATVAGRLVGRAIEESASVLAVNNTVSSASAVGETLASTVRDHGRKPLRLNAHLEEFLTSQSDAVLDALAGDASLTAVVDRFFEELPPVDASERVAVSSLTAALRPCDRSLLIATLRRILDDAAATQLDDVPLVVSATQLVEAGVDVSFDAVYRDFAPVPSIVQAAGRCNRSFGQDTGVVTVWQLAGDPRPPSELIYTRGSDRLEPSRVALESALAEHGEEIPEATMVDEVVGMYYDALYARDHTSDAADSLVTSYRNAEGETLRDASLIEDETAELLVVRNDEELQRIGTYLRYRTSSSAVDGQSAFGVLKYLLASVRADQPEAMADTRSVLEELGYPSVDLPELDILDDRDGTRYTITNGLGLREPTDPMS